MPSRNGPNYKVKVFLMYLVSMLRGLYPDLMMSRYNAASSFHFDPNKDTKQSIEIEIEDYRESWSQKLLKICTLSNFQFSKACFPMG